VYAAGALAIKLGVLDWNWRALEEAVLSCELDGLKPKVAVEESTYIAASKKLADYFKRNKAKAMDLRKRVADPKTHTFRSVPYYIASFRGHSYCYLTAEAMRSIFGVGPSATRYKQSLVDGGRLDVSSGGRGGRRFVVERRIFAGKGKNGMEYVHAIKTGPLKKSA
jgi:hypothetical protein